MIRRNHDQTLNNRETSSLSFPTWVRLFLLGVLFVTAFLVRAYRVDEPLMYFHPVRQYRSAIIARGYYFEGREDVAEWRRDLAARNRKGEGILEPPILERLVSFCYAAAGGEQLWIPRMFSIASWLMGGMFLFLMARRIASEDAALCAAAFYLFLPYSVAASRSFQPDPTMTAAMLFGLLAIERFYEQPGSRRLIVAALSAAAALLIKPMCIFIIMGVWFFRGLYDQGSRRIILSKASAIFLALSLSPSLVYYVYGIFMVGFIGRQAGSSFIPGLFLEDYYYTGWLIMIHRVVTIPFLIIALVGVWLSRSSDSRALLFGMWAGYFALGLVFNYHIHTHDYYQLQLIPIVALSLALIIDFGLARLSGFTSWRLTAAVVVAVTALGAFYNVAKVRADRGEREPLVKNYIKISREIGEAVDHSNNTIMLDYAWGKPLIYYGEFSGRLWPGSIEIKRQADRGDEPMTVEQRLHSLDPGGAVEFFIVVALEDFARQRDLQRFLFNNFLLAVKNEKYLIFDLRRNR